MATIGGLSSIWGAPFGVGVTFLIKDLIQSRLEDILHVRGGEYELIVYGIILVLIMIFMPEGLTAAASTKCGDCGADSPSDAKAQLLM